MSKNSIQDILPPDRRPPRRPIIKNSDSSMKRSFEATNNSSVKTIRRPKDNRGSYFYIAIGSILVVLFLGFIFSFLFSGAEVRVIPKNETLTVSGEFSASIDAEAGELSYQIMRLEESESVTVPSDGRETAETKASGQIVIFNDYNSSSQRLIRNTRFETPDGLVYRIDESIVVPGQTKENGKDIPGQIEVTVYADELGDGYNIGLTDFTVPGFEGAPQFDHFYARSKTSMTGGFIGEKLFVDDNTLSSTVGLLQTSLRGKLLEESKIQTPEGFILFDEATFIEFRSNPTKDSGNDVEVNENATFYGVLFNEKELAKHIAQNTLGSFDDDPVTFTDTNNLVLSVPNKDTAKPWVDEIFIFSLNGTSNIEWLFDENDLKEDLSGRNKDAIHTILSGYPSIEEAEVVIRPFWRNVFPTEVSEIEIKKVESN